ncbi:hypothetical protein [Catenuloplanes japonicus]|uniref:hypothetical protein n=1 Tax=Catenuloplanes japonicus TaxID=33876 RepID=UPI00068F675F|nr:hypothetical protein [Catenuloplanes japonicus]
MSIRAYAAHLGLSTSTVLNWDRRGTLARLNTETQQLLDIDLERAPEDVRIRFHAEVGVMPAQQDPVSDITFPDAQADAEEKDPMRRRTVLASLVTVITTPITTPANGQLDLDKASGLVVKIRRAYQSSRYRQALTMLPPALSALASGAHDDARATALTSEAYQVASGLLLKFGDPVLAAIAAERSITAARACGDPLAVASSMRAVAHGLLAGGHAAHASRAAETAAHKLATTIKMRSAQEFSVYGALLLRGAVAAARSENTNAAGTLLDEASLAARHTGPDGNARWTTFNPTNVLIHRVGVAVELGDAGAAIRLAQSIDPTAIQVPERRAMLLLDTGRAFIQWGKYERAFSAIQSAEEQAPEEVRTRRSVHLMLHDIARRSPLSMQRHVRTYIESLGASV